MISQFILSFLLGGVLLYAATQWRRSRFIALLAEVASLVGLYLVWVPSEASRLARWAGVGRGVDLIIYIWVAISLLIFLNLHLKMRAHTELITTLARSNALENAARKSNGSVANPAKPG